MSPSATQTYPITLYEASIHSDLRGMLGFYLMRVRRWHELPPQRLMLETITVV